MKSRINSPTTLVTSLAQIRAVQRFTLEALNLQQLDRDLQAHSAAARWAQETARLLEDHVEEVDSLLASLDGSTDALRSATRSVAGALFTLLSKLRPHDASAILRENHALVSVAHVEYLALQATASALGQPRIAEAAMNHALQLAAKLQELLDLLPQVTLDTLARESDLLDRPMSQVTYAGAALNRTPFPLAASV